MKKKCTLLVLITQKHLLFINSSLVAVLISEEKVYE